jgi:hypothetical protein
VTIAAIALTVGGGALELWGLWLVAKDIGRNQATAEKYLGELV